MIDNKPLYKVREFSDLKDMINQSSELFGDKNAFMYKNDITKEIETVTYSKYKKDIDSLGTSLLQLGLKDKRIAVISNNRYEWAVSYMAIVNGTGVVVPIDRSLPNEEIERIINRSKVSAIIYSNKYSDLMLELSTKDNNLEYFIQMDEGNVNERFLSFNELLDNGYSSVQNGNIDFLDAKIDADKMSSMLFTSGTSDVSKAVMLSHKNISSNIMAACSMFKIYETDVFLSFLPLHHVFECTGGFLAAIYNGATIAYCEGLRHIANNIKEFKVTIMFSVPLLYESMHSKIMKKVSESKGGRVKLRVAMAVSDFFRDYLKIDLSKKIFKKIHDGFGGNVRIFVSGAAAINPKVSKDFRSFGIKFLQAYGLTECSPAVTVNNDKYFKDASVGLPIPGVKVKIDNPNERNIGEIVTTGPNVMLGYYEDETSTNEVIKDGWFYTGDLGYLDKDGFLYITGRKKNVIVLKNGKNIFPEELEMLINKSQYIKESIVWGKEDENNEVTLCATIVVDYGYIEENLKDKELSKEEIVKIIDGELKKFNKRMPLYKYIREFAIREEEFVKTTTQKIKRFAEENQQSNQLYVSK